MRGGSRAVCSLCTPVPLLVSSCGGNTVTPPPPPVRVERVDVSSDAASIAIGGTVRFSATAMMSNGTSRNNPVVRWESQNTTVATINELGVATGHAPR